MDTVSTTAVCISGALIFTTIHAQDFADVEGDMQLGRTTFPIYAPELSRQSILAVILIWSVFLGYFWEVGPYWSGAFVVLGIAVGLRYYFRRSPEADSITYIMYNVSDILIPFRINRFRYVALMCAERSFG